jgi:hypothetical protein
MYPENLTFNTVWFDAILFMRPQLPFSGLQDILRIQLWMSEDQVLLLGGAVKNDPEEILLWASDMSYIARPGEGNPWFEPVNTIVDDMSIDLRLIYGAVALLKSGYNGQEYQFIGEERIGGRPAWKISELDDKMTPIAEISLDKETGFILRYRRDPSYPLDRESRAYLPQEAMITALEYDVDFPQDLFSPTLPWRGGYAWDPSGKPIRVMSTP